MTTRYLLILCLMTALFACGGEGQNVLVPPTPVDQTAPPADLVTEMTPADVVAPADISPEVVPLPDIVDVTATPEVLAEVVAEIVEVDVPPPPCMADTDCDDGKSCTTDSCIDGQCLHEAPPGLCCTTAADCADGIACTDDKCVGGSCKHYQDDNLCCWNDAMCADTNDCTRDRCVAERCSHTFVNGYQCTCQNYLDCDDGLACTSDSCADGQCVYQAKAGQSGCCASDGQCADNDPVTNDQCIQLTCSNLPATKCTKLEHCDDANPCTLDACEGSGYCSHADLADCCLTNGDCDDQTPLTVDVCAANTCAHSLANPPVDCVSPTDCPAPADCISHQCVGGICSAVPVSGGNCCLEASSCNDNDLCTADTCSDFQCTFSPVSGFVAHQVWNFDDGSLDGFAIEGGGFGVTWQLATKQAISLPNSVYFGNPAGPNGPTLNNGKTVAGKLVTPAATLPEITPHLLRVWAFIDCEALFSRDVVTIYVRHDGQDTPVWTKEDIGGTTALSWKELEVDLTPLNLGGKSVQLVFGFDSIDAVNNNYQGLYFDDIRLLWPCPPQL